MRSIRKRFVFTFGANVLRSLLGFTTGMLLARWFGPEQYGIMAFLLGTFVAIRQLLDMGSSSVFFTFMSQRTRSKYFVWAFFCWLGAQFLIPLVVIGLLFPTQWIKTIWDGEPRGLVLLAFAATFMQNSLWPIIQQNGESGRQTFLVQGSGVVVAIAHLFTVVLLWQFDMLGLYAVFVAIALEYLLAAIIVHRHHRYAPASSADSASEPVFRKFLMSMWPLIPYSWIGFAYTFADRWLLQTYGGSIEQAYYAVGAQFAGITLIATSSMLSIFWKEVAEAHELRDHKRTRMLYRKVSRLLFLAGASMAGFLVPWAQDLLRLIFGAAYAGGAVALAIMFVYPVHQSMGQIGCTMLYATERISLQVIIGIGFMITSMAMTYWVLAPPEARVPGLGMASVGLAVKMVVTQIIQVNIVSYVVARVQGWSFDWAYQPVGMGGCLGLGWGAWYVVNSVNVTTGMHLHLILAMALAGVLYLVLLVGFVFAMPWLLGLTREELRNDARSIWRGMPAVA
jgi:O-antigen/teichoic acid export membrane protein